MDKQVDRGELTPGTFYFACNICGTPNFFDLSNLDREAKSCAGCNSNARWRAVVDALSHELFGESVPLPDFPVRRDIRGIGLSDWPGYANLLREKFDYRNTFYHKEPRLDIADIDSRLEDKADFLIASDVFEHVAPPIAKAFSNARGLLKAGGIFLLTVPWGGGPWTREHYPRLNKFEIVERDGRKILRNLRPDGVLEEHIDPRFHGGDGAVLEMRLFGKQELIENLKAAGFASIRVHEGPKFQIGVYWPGNQSVPVAARC
jgi:SAM-dependent methyltransferase